MRGKKILINYLGSKGAGPKYSINMSKGLLNAGLDVYAIIPSNIENLMEWQLLLSQNIIIIENYHSVWGKINLFKKLIFSRALKQEIRGIKPDTVYIPMIGPFSFLINRLFNCKKITTLHDPIPHKGSNRFINILADITCLYSDKIIVLSKQFVEYTSKKYNKELDCIYHIPHPVFELSIKDEQEDIIQSKADFNFTFLGRIEKYKGIEVFLHSILSLERKYNISITIAGHGSLQEYDQKIKKIENKQILNFWLNENQIHSIISKSNTYVVLPYSSGTQSGLIPLLQNYKTKFIASDLSGIKEQITSQEILFKSNSISALTEKLIDICENKIDFKNIIEQEYKFIKKKNWKNACEQLIKVL